MIHSRFVKFIPIINVWEAGVQNSIIDGVLRLQRGQWVRCGDSRPSRFVRVTRGSSIWLIHYSPNQASEFGDICKWMNRWRVEIVPWNNQPLLVMGADFLWPISPWGDCSAEKNGRGAARGGGPLFSISIYIYPLKLFWDFSKKAWQVINIQ